MGYYNILCLFVKHILIRILLFGDIVTTNYSRKMSPMHTKEETYHMTDKEIARLIVAERLIDGDKTE